MLWTVLSGRGPSLEDTMHGERRVRDRDSLAARPTTFPEPVVHQMQTQTQKNISNRSSFAPRPLHASFRYTRYTDDTFRITLVATTTARDMTPRTFNRWEQNGRQNRSQQLWTRIQKKGCSHFGYNFDEDLLNIF